MGYNTASTEWPSISPSSEIKALIDELFLVLDSDKDGAGEQLADKVFMHDGVLVGPKGKFEGTEGITLLTYNEPTMVRLIGLLRNS